MLNRIINNEGSGTGEWTLLSRIIWLKATVLAAAGAAWHTVTGAIVQFVTARAAPIKELVVNVDPVQDLHGYDSPWPPGGGKNKFNKDASDNVLDGYVLSTDGSFKISSDGEKSILLGEFSPGTYTISKISSSRFRVALYGSIPAQNTPAIEFLEASPQTATNATITTTATGYIVVFCYNGSSETVTIQQILDSLQIEAGSTASAYSSYSNECPISGWTGTEISRTGVNVWDEVWEVGNIAVGANTPSSVTLRSKNYIPVKPNTTYYFATPNEKSKFVFFYDENKTYLYNGSTTGNTTFTTGDGCYYIRFANQYYIQDYGTYNHDISINYPATDTDYHAYAGNTYPIDWTDEAGTVYAAEVTVKQDGSVDLVVTHKGKTFTGSPSEEWSYTAAIGNGIFTIQVSDRYYSENVASVICNIAKGISYRDRATYSGTPVVYVDDGYGMVFRNFNYSDLTAWTTFLANENAQIVYKLAEPLTYHLASIEQLVTLVGQNNVWANTGDVTVTFRGTPVVEPDEQPLQALNLLLGGAYRNNQTQDDVSDEEALDILLGGADR